MRRLVVLLAMLVFGLLGYTAYAAVTGPGSEDYDFTVPAQTVTNPDGTSAILSGTLHVHVEVPAPAPPPPPPPPPPPVSTVVPGIGLIRYASGNTSTLTNADKYAVLDVSTGNAAFAASKPGRSLVYRYSRGACDWCGVTVAQAQANNWLLKDSAGNTISDGTYPLLDVGLPAVQKAWADNTLAFIASYPGLDGVFIDNVISSLTTYPPKYPNRDSWDANAVLPFMSAVWARLHPAGVYVATNSADWYLGQECNIGTCARTWMAKIAPYADGQMAEDWMFRNGHTRRIGASWDNYWNEWQAFVGYVQSLGDDFLPSDSASPLNTQVAVYGRASFLLDWNGGGGAFFYAIDYNSGDPWDPAWTVNLGLPTGAKTQPQANVWKRTFERGIVIVNPTGASITQDGHTIASGDAYIGG